MARFTTVLVLALLAHQALGEHCSSLKYCACGPPVCSNVPCPKKKHCACGPDVCPGMPCRPSKKCECGPDICKGKTCPVKQNCKCGPPVCPGEQCQQSIICGCSQTVSVCEGEPCPESKDCPCFTDLGRPSYCPSVPGDLERCPNYLCKCSAGNVCTPDMCLDVDYFCPCDSTKCYNDNAGKPGCDLPCT
jgi:hypothetical protein